MRRCAVIIAAWRAERWIAECLRSIRRQRVSGAWAIETRIGVDGCPVTSQKLLELGVGHWYSERNVGPYIIRNSLIGMKRADAYATFDADDVMLPGYLERLLRLVRKDGIAGSARATIGEDGRLIMRRNNYGHGVAIYSHNAWVRLGGFRPWRITADSDLIARALKLGIPLRTTGRPLYRRRRHPGSLTQCPETKMGSDLREQLKALSRELRDAGDLVVEPETVQLTWRGPRVR